MSNEIQRHERYKQYAIEAYHVKQEKYKDKRFQDIPLEELETAIGYFI